MSDTLFGNLDDVGDIRRCWYCGCRVRVVDRFCGKCGRRLR